jgi:hypothetical protein
MGCRGKEKIEKLKSLLAERVAAGMAPIAMYECSKHESRHHVKVFKSLGFYDEGGAGRKASAIAEKKNGKGKPKKKRKISRSRRRTRRMSLRANLY